MIQYVIMSPNYELLRYGHDKIQKQVDDAHAVGKKAKFIITKYDLIECDKPAEPSNFRFEICQYQAADVVVFVNGNDRKILKGVE